MTMNDRLNLDLDSSDPGKVPLDVFAFMFQFLLSIVDLKLAAPTVKSRIELPLRIRVEMDRASGFLAMGGRARETKPPASRESLGDLIDLHLRRLAGQETGNENRHSLVSRDPLRLGVETCYLEGVSFPDHERGFSLCVFRFNRHDSKVGSCPRRWIWGMGLSSRGIPWKTLPDAPEGSPTPNK